MNILIVGPIELTIPPKGYGGGERFAYWLAKGLLKLGHDVEIICRKSKAGIKTIPTTKRYFVTDNEERIVSGFMAAGGDIHWADAVIDNTRDSVFAEYANMENIPVISFTHGMDGPCIYNPIALSIDQKAKWATNDIKYLSIPHVYIGAPEDEYEFNPDPKDYILWLGKINEIKGLEYFISLCLAKKVKGIVAGPVHDPRKTGYGNRLLEKLDRYGIEYVGEVSGENKVKLLKEAKALVFPTLVRESFGIVVIEAMLCGTPVITWDIGPMRELVGVYNGAKGRGGWCGGGVFHLALDRGVDYTFNLDRESVYEYALNKFNNIIMASRVIEILESLR